MAELKAQEKDLIYALDIGTRSIVGVVGRPVGDRLKVLDVEMAEHGKRAMMDGQIDDIRQVAGLARTPSRSAAWRPGRCPPPRRGSRATAATAARCSWWATPWPSTGWTTTP